VLQRIRYFPGGYTPVEAELASAILEDPERVTRESITSLCNRTAVSAGSVIRFARRLGFSGLRELKLAIAQEIGRTSIAETSEAPPTDGLEGRIEHQIQALAHVRSSINPAAYERACVVLAEAKNVDIVASGASAALGEYALFLLTVRGAHVRFLRDPWDQAAAAGFLVEGDVMLALSYSGRSKGVVDAAERAHRGGAQVLAVTCNAKAPLLHHASAELVVDVRQMRRVESEWVVRTALFGLMNALLLDTLDRAGEDERGTQRRTWASGRYGMRYSDAGHAGEEAPGA
jgi:RpiR family carbohydrate utilization transcriptional regulator